jgi:hypothetical protein
MALNWVSVNTVKLFKIHHRVIHLFFCKCILPERERPPKVIFQSDVVHNWPNKLPQKSREKNSSPSIGETTPFVIHKPQNGCVSVQGLIPKGPRGPKWVAAKTGHVITNCDLFWFKKNLECIILVKRGSWGKKIIAIGVMEK